MKQGITNEFNSEGKVLKKTIFVEGKEQGLAYEYDKEGIIITIIDYQKGLFPICSLIYTSLSFFSSRNMF